MWLDKLKDFVNEMDKAKTEVPEISDIRELNKRKNDTVKMFQASLTILNYLTIEMNEVFKVQDARIRKGEMIKAEPNPVVEEPKPAPKKKPAAKKKTTKKADK